MMSVNVLVIDDEVTVCKSCQRILSEDGYDVTMVLSGREGLERAEKEDFDLVIVDLKMPDINGMEVVDAVKKARPGMPVIIMTGYSTVPSAVEGMKLGAADYIPKPFTPDEMITAVKKALQQKRREPEPEGAGVLINKEAIIEVLTRAAEDKEFAVRLSEPDSDMLEDYDLSPQEKAALVSVINPSEEEAMLVVSHELKSPLASIANLARAIQEPNVAGDRKEKFLGRIVSRAESALGMIEEYLTLSRISAGELEIAPRKVNFYSEVVEKVLDDQSEAMAEKDMGARIDIPRELEVACDSGHIQMVYNNLISNATKYGTPGTEIQLGYSETRSGHHLFNVANVGEWIKEGDRERVFEKYVTLGKRGTGIGLHAAREIIRRHGGNIWVEPCYFVRGKVIAAESVIEETTVTERVPDRLIRGNNFVFTIPVGEQLANSDR
jgi:DNA-binding response OmpR family regulator